jgi:uncharacterized protein (DUF3084 family)
MERWQQFILALLATGGFIQLIQLLIKLIGYLADRFNLREKEEMSLVLRDKDELANVREWLAEELEKASQAYEKVKEERHQLEMKLVIIDRDLKDERRFSSDQAAEIQSLIAERDQLRKENDRLVKLSLIGSVQQEE